MEIQAATEAPRKPPVSNGVATATRRARGPVLRVAERSTARAPPASLVMLNRDRAGPERMSAGYRTDSLTVFPDLEGPRSDEAAPEAPWIRRLGA
ncbi:hypothetical protein GCM10023160_26010 [Brachybacterium paraconglomeratum]